MEFTPYPLCGTVEWKKEQEEMLQEYLNIATDNLQTKQEVYDIKMKRFELAKQEMAKCLEENGVGDVGVGNCNYNNNSDSNQNSINNNNSNHNNNNHNFNNDNYVYGFYGDENVSAYGYDYFNCLIQQYNNISLDNNSNTVNNSNNNFLTSPNYKNNNNLTNNNTNNNIKHYNINKNTNSNIEHTKNKITSLSFELTHLKSDLTFNQQGVDTLKRLKETTGMMDGKNVVEDIFKMDESIRLKEEEKKELLRSLAGFGGISQNLPPPITTITMDAINEHTKAAGNHGEMLQLREDLQYNNNLINNLDQQLQHVEADFFNDQVDFNKMILFHEKGQLLNELGGGSSKEKEYANEKLRHLYGHTDNTLNQSVHNNHTGHTDHTNHINHADHNLKNVERQQLKEALKTLLRHNELIQSRLKQMSKSTTSISSGASSLGSLSSTSSIPEDYDNNNNYNIKTNNYFNYNNFNKSSLNNNNYNFNNFKNKHYNNHNSNTYLNNQYSNNNYSNNNKYFENVNINKNLYNNKYSNNMQQLSKSKTNNNMNFQFNKNNENVNFNKNYFNNNNFYYKNTSSDLSNSPLMEEQEFEEDEDEEEIKNEISIEENVKEKRQNFVDNVGVEDDEGFLQESVELDKSAYNRATTNARPPPSYQQHIQLKHQQQNQQQTQQQCQQLKYQQNQQLFCQQQENTKNENVFQSYENLLKQQQLNQLKSQQQHYQHQQQKHKSMDNIYLLQSIKTSSSSSLPIPSSSSSSSLEEGTDSGVFEVVPPKMVHCKEESSDDSTIISSRTSTLTKNNENDTVRISTKCRSEHIVDEENDETTTKTTTSTTTKTWSTTTNQSTKSTKPTTTRLFNSKTTNNTTTNSTPSLNTQNISNFQPQLTTKLTKSATTTCFSMPPKTLTTFNFPPTPPATPTTPTTPTPPTTPTTTTTSKLSPTTPPSTSFPSCFRRPIKACHNRNAIRKWQTFSNTDNQEPLLMLSRSGSDGSVRGRRFDRNSVTRTSIRLKKKSGLLVMKRRDQTAVDLLIDFQLFRMKLDQLNEQVEALKNVKKYVQETAEKGDQMSKWVVENEELKILIGNSVNCEKNQSDINASNSKVCVLEVDKGNVFDEGGKDNDEEGCNDDGIKAEDSLNNSTISKTTTTPSNDHNNQPVGVLTTTTNINNNACGF